MIEHKFPFHDNTKKKLWRFPFHWSAIISLAKDLLLLLLLLLIAFFFVIVIDVPLSIFTLYVKRYVWILWYIEVGDYKHLPSLITLRILLKNVHVLPKWIQAKNLKHFTSARSIIKRWTLFTFTFSKRIPQKFIHPNCFKW